MRDGSIVITGTGCISPLGHSTQETWAALIAGRSGVGPISLFDASGFKTRIAAEVKDFDPLPHLGAKLARRTDRFTQFALVATAQAVADARLEINEGNRDRIGVVIGTGIGGVGSLLEGSVTLLQRGPRRVSPFMVPMMLPDSAAGQIAIEFGVRGPNMAIVTACASGNNAIGEAAELIRRGDCDMVIAGGAEAAIVPVALAGFNNMGAVSTRNQAPQEASRPFDRLRDGFVMGEGAAVVILESEAHARARGARMLAQVRGYAATNDAYHISAPAENGAGAAQCMRLALRGAGMNPEDIDYINAHGTSTPLNDASETAAIKAVFGAAAYSTPVSSSKSMTGHLLGAAGALEAVICVQVLQEGIIPPTINYQNPDPRCDLDYVPNQAREAPVRACMSNSFGFGGHNACLILTAVEQGG